MIAASSLDQLIRPQQDRPRDHQAQEDGADQVRHGAAGGQDRGLRLDRLRAGPTRPCLSEGRAAFRTGRPMGRDRGLEMRLAGDSAA